MNQTFEEFIESLGSRVKVLRIDNAWYDAEPLTLKNVRETIRKGCDCKCQSCEAERILDREITRLTDMVLQADDLEALKAEVLRESS